MSSMSLSQQILTIALCVAATMLTRFLPFVVFSAKDKQPPAYIQYLGKALPAAIFGMLVVYCLKGVSVFVAPHGLPELLAIAFIFLLHLWKRNTLLSIGGGTLVYILLVQLVF